MCRLCFDIQKELLTPLEIARNYREATFYPPEHWQDVMDEIIKKDLFNKVTDEFLKLNLKDKK